MQNANQNHGMPEQSTQSVLADKWSAQTMACGYTVVPDVLLEHMGELGLTPTELVVMLQVMRFWWRADQLPFPSKHTLAQAMGMTDKNVQKVIGRLHEKGWMKRIMRRRARDRHESNRYDFAQLVATLRDCACWEFIYGRFAEVEEEAFVSLHTWRTGAALERAEREARARQPAAPGRAAAPVQAAAPARPCALPARRRACGSTKSRCAPRSR